MLKRKEIKADPAPEVAKLEPHRTGTRVERTRPTDPVTPGVIEEARFRQRLEYGGMNWGSAFFGWLAAMGVAVILMAIVSAAGVALGLTSSAENQDATTLGITGGLALLVVLALAYFAGGYVAGRMSRFDGGRQGFGVWLWGLLATILVALTAVVLGSEYNIFGNLNLPNVPVNEGDLTTGGLIALAVVLFGTLFSAIMGGKVGEGYHRKVDRAATRPAVAE